MAAQADAGMLQDITSSISSWSSTINAGALGIYAYKGKQYGVPWDMGMIGVWYNKALFTKAGIAAVPTTWDDFLADVSKLKASGTAPLAIAGKDDVAVDAPLDVPHPPHGRIRCAPAR
jgi:raffinose/stachyose/melibiose transport system substrate-binding protein